MYAGPLDELIRKGRELAIAMRTFNEGAKRLVSSRSRITALETRATASLAPDKAAAFRTRLATLRKDGEALRGAQSTLSPIVAKAQDFLKKLAPGTFGVAPLVLIPAGLAAIAAALVVLKNWTTREARLAAEVELEARKLDAVLKGDLPTDVIRPKESGDPLDKLKGLLMLGAAVYALTIVGPMLRRRSA